MTDSSCSRIAGWLRCVVAAAAIVLAAGCATPEQISGAITDVNKDFQVEYEAILAKEGTRVCKAPRNAAYAAVGAALFKLGMTVETSDLVLGYINVYAAAPSPLSREEWETAAKADLPRMRKIAARHIGEVAAEFIRFEPEGLQIVINATVIEVKAGTEISLTMRMRETAPPKSGMPRREYAPPTGVRIGLAKIWAAVGRDLPAGGGCQPPSS